ncbi:hypothetical protein EXIGLDRAFT_647264 [Exidia glandulosa HHB12029]|uniref:DUF7726 domain-containing protein n=1 Tax=Exidia glandulosa HHB12029 TaxID=1314781 RepID=A0A165HTZ2_EXIGL|nr:hypothetical protein EXIGLDRAFT_647264 [Exidia glandulosa HHB12029]
MAPKRKSDEFFEGDDEEYNPKRVALADKDDNAVPVAAPAKKKTSKKADKVTYASWRDVPIEGEDEGDIQIYDDCNDIRRKIRALQKTPGFKITHWLSEIGGINSNSFGRFMKATGPMGGAENGTYEAAYKYFEKVRIMEGKKKTPKRLEAETEHPGGRDPRDSRRKVWVFTGR